jgi:hypothetical protein
MCEHKYFGSLNVNEEYLLTEGGRVGVVLVISTDLTPDQAVKQYQQDYVWNLRMFGAPRGLIRTTDPPQYLGREVARGAFGEVSVWYIGDGNFLLMFLTGSEGKVTTAYYYAPRNDAAKILKIMANVSDPGMFLSPGNSH